MSEKQVPKGALRFVDEGHGCQAFVDFAEGDDQTPKLSMVGYSGKIIKDHWYWGNLAIDLQGMKFEESRYPILENHDTSRKVAFMGKPVVDEQGQLVAPNNSKLLDTEAADEFIKLSKQGFPYQSSISAKPLIVEKLEEGAKAEVNGFTMKGPGTIWRGSKFREMSVCVFGWDNKTSASAFSKEPVDIDYDEKVINAESDLSDNQKPVLKRREVKEIMNLEELKEKYPDIYEAALKLGREAAEAEFSKEKTVMEAKLETMQKDNESMSEKVLELEKKDAIRTESELKAEGSKIWLDKLSNSKIPERYYDKVQPHVSYSKFVENGVLDVEKFGEAIDAEIKDWEDRGMTEQVLGSGFVKKEVNSGSDSEEEEETKKNDMAIAENLVHLAGHQTKADLEKKAQT
jgi:hypothetical protein